MGVPPREIVVGLLDLYLAPVGEAFTVINVSPAGNWGLLGTNGKGNYAEDGLTCTHEQTITEHFTAGSTGPVKATRSQERMTIAGIMLDLSLEEYAKLLNDVTVNTVAGPPSRRWIPLRQGPDVSRFALQAKGTGLSPYGDFPLQLETPIVYQAESPAPVFHKETKAALNFSFAALEDRSAATDEERFGRWNVQDS